MSCGKPQPAGFSLQWTEWTATTLLDSVKANYYHWNDDEISSALQTELVQINGLPVNQDCALVPADNVSLWLAEHTEGPADTDWKLLWQTPELMAVHKPAQLPVSRTTRNLFNTLISLVRRATEYKNAHLLHRLDAETSGLILLANYDHADRKWKKRLDRLIQAKRYHALVWGNPDWQKKTFSCYLAEKQNSAVRTQMHVVEADDPGCVKTPKLSTTVFTVLKQFDGYALVECELHTGRKHQLRAQLAHLNHAIIGDKIYSHNGAFYLKRLQQDLSAEDYQPLGSEHHLLHAWQLQLDTGKEQLTLTDNDYPDAWYIYLKNK